MLDTKILGTIFLKQEGYEKIYSEEVAVHGNHLQFILCIHTINYRMHHFEITLAYFQWMEWPCVRF